MNAVDLVRLVGGLVGTALGLVFVAGIAIAVFGWPFLAVSAVRSLRRIAVALEQLNARPLPAATSEREIGPWKPRATVSRSEPSSVEPFR